LIDLCLTT